MSKMIQLRNVPDALHRTLKARAAMEGMSLSDYLLSEIKEIAERPTLTEFRARLRAWLASNRVGATERMDHPRPSLHLAGAGSKVPAAATPIHGING